MIEMSHTEEDTKEPNLSAGEEENQPMNDVSEKCHTALEILQNELMNCERNISLEKSVHKQNELEDVSSEITPDYILNENDKLADFEESLKSNTKDIFSNDQCSELIGNIIRVGNHFNEIEEDDVQKIIFEYAEINKIGHDFDRTSRKTGNEWYQRFLRLHPQMNSVIKKSRNDFVQLDETDASFSSRIVDKFLSDYKKIRKDEEEIRLNCNDCSESLSVVKIIETENRNESSQFFGKGNALTVEGSIEDDNAYSATATENLDISCFTDTLNCVKNFRNEELFDPVSSVCSKNVCLVDESSTNKNYSVNNENILDQSNEKCNVTFDNVAETKDDGENDVNELNLNNSIIDVLPTAISDSSRIPPEGLVVITRNDYSSAKKTNTLTQEDSSRDETADIISTEAVGIESKSKTNDDIVTETRRENNESVDVGNLNDDRFIFSEHASCTSGPEISHFITSENAAESSCFVNNVSTSTPERSEKKEDNSTDLDTVCDKKSNDEVDLNAPSSSIRSASKRKETESSISVEGEIDEKKPKISKKKRPPSQRKIKRPKYLYKLKSYSGSVLFFTSSTSVSFIKPVIKLTKLDENSCNDVDTSITSVLNTTTPSETNHADEVKNDSSTDSTFQIQVETQQNCNTGLVLEDHVGVESDPNPGDNFISPIETKTTSPYNDLKEPMEIETNPSPDNNLKEQREPEASSSPKDDLKEKSEPETNPITESDLKNHSETESQSTSIDESECEIEKETNLNSGDDFKGQVAEPPKISEEKNVNGSHNNSENASPILKMNTSVENVTPTFGMQTRRKRLKFLPDGTLVTPNQKHQRFSDEFTTTSRSESKTTRKRSLKNSSQEIHKVEKKIKTVSAPASSTPKQSNRSALSTKKVSKNQPDRYIPKSNGQSKKPQKIFDYDSYYRENFRQTEVKLPSSCKKQMVALSKVTSISPGAQSGSSFTVNPAQLLSCLLSMPITPDQIRTVRFKPPNKQLKPNKQVNITPSKLASNDAIRPITKRHLELLQRTPFNIVPKTEIGVAKATANSKSQSTSQ